MGPPSENVPKLFCCKLGAEPQCQQKEDLMSRTNACFALCLLLICSTVAVVPASAQHFQLMKGSLTQIAAGRNQVWGLNGGKIYRFHSATKKFVQVSPGFVLAQIAVGGGSLLQPDEVWATDSEDLWRFNLSTNTWTLETANSTDFFNVVAVGEGDEDDSGCHPYEVWALASTFPANPGLPYRFNYCNGSFDQIPLPPNSTTNFTHIATGGSDTWALDANAHIWHYNQYENTWFQVTKGGFDGTLQQITVGVNDAWGLDANGTVYRYVPSTATFVQVQAGSSIDVTQIAASGDGVWALQASSPSSGLCNVYRFQSYGLGSLTPGGGGFQAFCLSSSGSLDATQIAVGSGAGIWVVNESGQVNTWVRP